MQSNARIPYIEYKTNWRDEYLKWICGFVNANGGKLYIDLDDKGKVTGIDNYNKLLEELPNKFLGKGHSMDACWKAGLPEPTLEEVAGGMQITFLKDIFSENYLKCTGLNERQIKAVRYIKGNGKISNSNYQELLGVARRTATRDLTELVEKGIFEIF